MGEFDFLTGNSKNESEKLKNKKTKPKTNIELDNIKTDNIKSSSPVKNNPDNLNLEKYIEQLKSKNPDPRPDIKEDHYIWIYLLREAKKVNNKAYSVLHFLRCGGCRLKLVRRGNGDPFIKLGLEKSEELLKDYIPGDLSQQLQEIEHRLQNTKAKDKQLKMFNSPDDRFRNNDTKLRKKNKKLSKEKSKLEEEAYTAAREKILNDVIMLDPYRKLIMVTFKNFQSVIKSAEKEIGEIYFNFTQFNNYLKKLYWDEKRKGNK